MAVAARRDDLMSVAEYRVWVETKPDSERWELLDGVPVLMAPNTGNHQRIVYNLLRRIGDLAEPKGCSAPPGLVVLSEAIDDFAPIPDVVVQCGPLPRDGYTRDPLLVVEVLSPSTMSMDRGRKVDFYMTVPSLRQFLVVYQDEQRIEIWHRSGSSDWAIAVFGAGDVIDLPELDGTLLVTDVYSRVTF